MASTIKVDNVQNQPGTNIINKCSTTVTLGASGDNIALASGATQTGFGASGAVSWDTASIKTAGFTAASTNGYFCNTTAGAFTVTLPAGAAGSIISIQDYANTFDSNNLTITPNGAEKINGGAGSITLTTEGEGLTIVYVDSTQGWRSIQDSDFSTVGSNYVAATGGTPCTGAIVCTNYKTHTFTGPGTFTITSAGAAPGSNTIDYLVVAGGGAGGSGIGGGGGAGGFRESPGAASGCYTTSPRGTSPAVALPVAVQDYPITVGGGASGGPAVDQAAGSNSIFSTITSAGGGGGAGSSGSPGLDGQDGGSGGGGSSTGGPPLSSGGVGNTPPAPVAQGMPGGVGGGGGGSNGDVKGGGGGATETGVSGNAPAKTSGRGGAGATTSISATPTAYAGGAGGGGRPACTVIVGAASPCGTGAAGAYPSTTNGTTNRGGGGGGGDTGNQVSGSGGSGVVIIRYKFQ